LVVKKDHLFAETVEKSQRLLRLDESGGMHIDPGVAGMGAKQKLELFLLGRYLAKEGGLTPSDTATDQEIARFFGLKLPEVQKRAHDLKNAGKITIEAGAYRLTDGRIGEVLRDLGAE
jgi:hypothetical protein